MPQLNDCRLAVLVAAHGAGHVNDLTLLWLQAAGATSDDLNDAWYEMLHTRYPALKERNDMWFQLLGDLGYTGALNDREHQFWCVGGGVLPPAVPVPANVLTTDLGDPLVTDSGEYITE